MKEPKRDRRAPTWPLHELVSNERHTHFPKIGTTHRHPHFGQRWRIPTPPRPSVIAPAARRPRCFLSITTLTMESLQQHISVQDGLHCCRCNVKRQSLPAPVNGWVSSHTGIFHRRRIGYRVCPVCLTSARTRTGMRWGTDSRHSYISCSRSSPGTTSLKYTMAHYTRPKT